MSGGGGPGPRGRDRGAAGQPQPQTCAPGGRRDTPQPPRLPHLAGAEAPLCPRNTRPRGPVVAAQSHHQAALVPRRTDVNPVAGRFGPGTEVRLRTAVWAPVLLGGAAFLPVTGSQGGGLSCGRARGPWCPLGDGSLWVCYPGLCPCETGLCVSNWKGPRTTCLSNVAGSPCQPQVAPSSARRALLWPQGVWEVQGPRARCPRQVWTCSLRCTSLPTRRHVHATGTSGNALASSRDVPTGHWQPRRRWL